MQSYSKGDIVKFKDGTIALILNNGIPGSKFVDQYTGQEITLMSSCRIIASFRVDGQCSYKTSKRSRDEYVWYRILVGDEHCWITNTALYYRINEYWPEAF